MFAFRRVLVTGGVCGAMGLAVHKSQCSSDDTIKYAGAAAVGAVAGFAGGYFAYREQKPTGLYDLEKDLLDRGEAVSGATSVLADKAVGKVIRSGPHAGEPYVYRIVLTGGPCGGKSSSLKHFSKKLTAMGFTVYCVPEVPTIMMNGGCKYPGNQDKKKLMEFEKALLRMQIQSERTFLQVAASTMKPAVVVCDRGINDIAAYMPADLWAELLESEGLTKEYVDSRYDLVLHMVTAADGAEKFYTTANNTARSETPEMARQLDKWVENAYSMQREKGKFAYIDNSTDFKNKLERATAAVIDMITVEVQK